MRVLELRKGSAEEAELLEAAAAAHGEWVLAAAPLTTRLWLMQSSWAPGLRYVGGLAVAPDVTSQSALPLSVGGAGLRLEDALAGCLAEAIERTAQIERDGDVVLTAPAISLDLPEQIQAQIDLITARDPAAADRPIDWMMARDAMTGSETLIPADWCLRRQKPSLLDVPGAALSTGCAAAVTADEALDRGILELVERDAASLWWLGGRPAAAISSDSMEAAAAARFIAELRQGDTGRVTRILDITSDLPVPVMAAVAHDADGTGLSIGLSARLSPARAASNALIELCQMELGLQLAVGKREQMGEAALAAIDRRHLERAAVDAATLAPLVLLETPRHHGRTESAIATTRRVLAALEQPGAAAWRVDLNRSTSSLKVVKAISPRLQPMPGDLITPRLSAVQKAVGMVPRPPVAIM